MVCTWLNLMKALCSMFHDLFLDHFHFPGFPVSAETLIYMGMFRIQPLCSPPTSSAGFRPSAPSKYTVCVSQDIVRRITVRCTRGLLGQKDSVRGRNYVGLTFRPPVIKDVSCLPPDWVLKMRQECFLHVL